MSVYQSTLGLHVSDPVYAQFPTYGIDYDYIIIYTVTNSRWLPTDILYPLGAVRHSVSTLVIIIISILFTCSKGDGLSYPTRITHSSDINNYHSTEDTGSPPAINSPTRLTPPQTKTPPEETVVNMPQQQASNTSNLPPSTISSTVTVNNNSTTGEVPSTNSTNAQRYIYII